MQQVPILPLKQSPLGALPARFRRPRILVIGFGDVGQRMARLRRPALSAGRGPSLLALVRDASQLPRVRALGGRALVGDLDQPPSLRRLAGVANHLLYLAPPPSPAGGSPDSGRDRRMRSLLAALRRSHLPQSAVYVSTSGVYGDCEGAWVTETRTAAPQTARAKRRVDAEWQWRCLGREQGWRASILRVPGIYAADRVGGTPKARLERGTAVLRPEDDVYTNHVHADDLARLLTLALWRGRAQRIYHACDDTQMRMGDYFSWAAHLYGLPVPPRISRDQARGLIPENLMSFMSESRRLSNSRAKRELGWVLHYPTVEQGLAPTIVQGRPGRGP